MDSNYLIVHDIKELYCYYCPSITDISFPWNPSLKFINCTNYVLYYKD